ncbi:HAD-IC family P-type ATPase [Cohnella silvisoli]|uniref:HAD-IC family P-type ATPase n=1 Tax=Cohnella silvisoli TaxID=2873699 RepID=A0ABV1KV73_9BACL|nr:HAD-IC family P-type ATPase [Cohnella silvisoli]MCD9023281.1 cation-translocating P-type ATPase [Cohnella silvisoli]
MVPQGKQRFLRSLPGRIRIEITGLKENPNTTELLLRRFSTMKGISRIVPNTVSGRALIEYDEARVNVQEIIHAIQQVELHLEDPRCSEAAAAAEMPPLQERLNPAGPKLSMPEPEPKEKVPIPLAIAMGGLAVLGAKRLFLGRSALAGSPIPFYLSGLVSVVTGYPFLRRGFESFSQTKKWNSDLLLGTSALALALVRENLVVLAGLGVLQFVNWKRSQLALGPGQENRLSPEIQSYSEKAAKWGLIGAAATWAITRNPLQGIAVLLAANPRPATIPAQYAWQQAEVVSHERNFTVPSNGSLSQLARTNTMLIEETSHLFDQEENPDEFQCFSKEEDAEKAVCYAASLMKSSGHPWKEDVWEHAKRTCRTIRSAFHVTEEDSGLTGKINDIPIYVGSSAYLKQHGIASDTYDLEAKRLERKGFNVLFVAKAGHKPEPCLGFIARKEAAGLSEWGKQLSSFTDKGWRIGVLQNRANVSEQSLKKRGIDSSWLSLQPGEIIERIALMQQQGENALFVADSERNPLNEYMAAAGIPVITKDQVPRLLETSAYVKQVDRTVNKHFQITKSWNLLGSALASLGALSAPVVNLAADALSLVFLTRSKKASERESPPLNRIPGVQEIAAASDKPVWHSSSREELMSRFQVDEFSGLSAARVAELQSRHGKNRLEGKKTTPWFVTYFGQFKEFTTLVLLGTTTFAFLSGGLFDGIAMGAILLANAAISTFQERKAEKVVQSLNQFQPPFCKVIRDGKESEISAIELIPGDIVHLEAGNRMPADIRLLQASNLRVNEAALTGESLPIDKNELPIEENLPLAERTNMLYMGTDICGGKGIGIVVNTGMDTEMGHLVSLLKQEEKEVTPLQEKVTSISKTFVKGALAAGVIVFVAGLLRGIPLNQMVSTSIALAASAIPEGLPVTITIALSAGIFRMAKKKTLVRKLSALETLGRTTIICTDKTGTLTKNEMMVRTVASVNRAWTVTGNGYEPVGDIQEVTAEVAATAAAGLYKESSGDVEMDTDLKRILEIGVLCNNSKLDQQEGKWIVKGDPTEGALLTLAAKKGMWPQDLSGWHRSHEVPFDSNTGKMSVVCKENAKSNSDCYVLTKGSVEAVLRRCSRYQANGELFELKEDQKRQILLQNEQLSTDALRVLAFAYSPIDGEQDKSCIDEQNLIYVGMAGMADPPKAAIEEGIRDAQALGVKPVMITGDHPITAVAIAKQIGIYDGTQKVLSGHELDRMTDEELSEVVENVSIFARVTPEHKLRIVTAFQKRGHIVAMTGDGVNDTPAIKQADVGIAMGEKGTEVTKEAADMVLQHDHFGSIVDGVKEGRTIIGNIRKALGCLLTGNLAEIIVTSAAVMLGLPIPLVPVQILLMNLLTDALPAMVLAVNPGNKSGITERTDIVDRRLYRKVVVRGVLLGLGSLGLFAASLATGAPIAVAQSVAFATLVAGQLLQTFSWRQEGSEQSTREWTKDRFLIGALGVSWLALLAALYVPPVSRFFHTAPLSLTHWIPVLLVAGSVTLLSKPILSLVSRRTIGSPNLQATGAAA